MLGTVIIPERAEIENCTHTVFLDSTLSMLHECRLTVTEDMNVSWLYSFDTSRARILRC